MDLCSKRVIIFSLSYIASALLILSSAFAVPDEEIDPIPSIPEIRESVLRHKKSVVNFGILALSEFSESFPELSKLPPHIRWVLVKSYLELHDNPKLWSVPDMKERSSKPSTIMPLQSMQDFWQQDIPHGDRGWIDTLNMTESAYKTAQLIEIASRLGVPLTRELLHEIFSLEDLADVLDTKLYRWKEMGFKKPNAKFAASRYFRHVRRLKTLAELAYKVESFWRMQGQSCLRLF